MTGTDGIESHPGSSGSGRDTVDAAKDAGAGPMIVREFAPPDTDAVVALWRTCGLTRPWNDPERDIERRRAVDDGLFLVGVLPADGEALDRDAGDGGARRGDPGDDGAPGTDGVRGGDARESGSADGFGKPAGPGIVVASAMGGYDGHRGWVYYLAVRPDDRGLGHGRAMMDELEARLLARGCPKINLQVRGANASTLAFYARLGYASDDVVGLGKRLIPDD